ncbi:MAG TPA: hypothetical protein VIY69_11685 [Candidatus Acidoferrales bacterium]
MPSKKIIAFPAPKKQKTKHDKFQKVPAPKPSAKLGRDAVFSFLKDTRGMVSWTARDLSETLGVTLAQANDALPVLEMQGYVRPSGKDEWLTTIEGETVSGSVVPRYKKEAVDEALASLQDRIRQLNADRGTETIITRAVAFGDFLSGQARVQAADVGIEAAARGAKNTPQRPSAALLSTLKAKSPMLHLLPFAPWMVNRTHRKLL